MSEPKLISPLLDDFSMGAALSEHDGVRCYPALKENSEKKYIVKIVSIPASQSQVDALLDHVQDAHLCVWAEEGLTGAALEEARASRIREMLSIRY